MKSDHRNATAGRQSLSQDSQAFFKRTKFNVHFHPQRLKSLGCRMMTSMTPDQLFDRARQRKSFAKRRRPAHLHDQAADPARSRFLTKFTKQASQFLFAVLVYNFGGSQFGLRIHAHVERTVSYEAETALRIFELAGGDTKIKKRAADRAKTKLVENTIRVP